MKEKTKKFFNKIVEFFYKGRYFWIKLGFVFITIFLTTIMIFFILRLTPGDTVVNYAKSIMSSRPGITYEQAYKEAVDLLNYDPDAPIFQQFGRFLSGLFNGSLGVSIYRSDVTAALLIKQKLPWTLFIATIALLVSFALGTYIGAIMARKRKTKADAAISTVVLVVNSIPDYLIGLLLIMLFSYDLKLFPTSGNYDIQYVPGFNLPFILNALWHAALPIISLVLASVGGWALQMRSNTIGVLGEDYIYCAKARGLSERVITRKYLKRNALLPLITSLALSFAVLFGGSTLIEGIFNYPGLGQELASRIGLRDYFVVQGILFFSSTIVIIVNFLTDMIYYLIDPRVRRGA